MAQWQELMRAPMRELRIGGKIVFGSGEECALDGDRVISIAIDEGAADCLEPGSVLSAACSVDLANADGQWNSGGSLIGQQEWIGASLMPELGILDRQEIVWEPLGVFEIVSARSLEGEGVLRLQAQDSISMELSAKYQDAMGYPRSLQEIWEDALGQTRYAWSGELPNGDGMVFAAPNWRGASLRTAIGCIAAAAGCFVRADRRGGLELCPLWKPNAAAYAIDGESYLKLESDSLRYGPVDSLKLKCTGAAEELIYCADGDRALCAISVSDNPLFHAGAPGLNALAQGMLEAVAGFTGEAMRFDWRGDPRLHIGDRVQICDPAGKVHLGVLTRQSLRFDGGLSAVCICNVPVNANSGVRRALTPEGGLNAAALTGAVNGALLSVGSVTANKLAAGSVTAEKIAAGAIDAISIDAITAKIDSLTAEDITTDRLAAALAAFSVVTAGTASFDKATVSHLVANLFNLTGSGVMDDVFIHNLKIAYAQMVSASIGNLVLQASNGEYYQIDVDQDGSVSATLVEPSAEEIASGVFGQTRPILATSMTVDDMNASSIKAVHMLINKIDAARIDVDQLFARQAFITQLTTRSIIGGKSLTIIAGEAEGAASAAKNAVKTYRQESAPDVADGVKNGDLWIKPSTGAISQADAIEFVLDENGDLYLNHGSGDGHSARFASGDPTMLETTFAMTLNADGEIISMPVTWMLVQDQTLANRINSNATTKVDVEYALGDSNTVAPTTDWTTTAPAQTQGQYIWSRTVTYFGDGTKSTGAASCLSTSLGKGISQIIEQYAVSGNAETAPESESDWQTTVPTPTSTKPYIWTRSEIVYVDGSKSHTPPQVQAKRYADILTDNLLDKVDGKTTVFYDPNEPETPNEGDLWYDTDADPVTIQRYSSGAWVEVTDSMLKKALDAAGEAKYIADKKIVTFAQDEAPTSGMSEGDLWIDTNDGNRLHRYNGTAWVAYQDASISQAQSAAETANAAAIAASESASEALTKANAAAKQADFQRVVRIDNAGLHVGDNITDTEVLITSGSVNVVVGGVSKSTFGDNFVRLGNALISNTNNGLVIDLYGG